MVRGYEGVDIRFALCIWITQCTSAPGQRIQSKMSNHGDMREHAPIPGREDSIPAPEDYWALVEAGGSSIFANIAQRN